jgi:plasmid stabilization system protein ParE
MSVRRRGAERHMLVYRVAAGHVVEILRILHDAMDAAQHRID